MTTKLNLQKERIFTPLIINYGYLLIFVLNSFKVLNWSDSHSSGGGGAGNIIPGVYSKINTYLLYTLQN